jgi:hypothetical protein
MKRPILLGLLIVLAGGVLHAQNLSTLRGTIKDPTGLVVAGASIRLKATMSLWTQKVESDMTGAFIINSIPIGQYTLEVQYPGFKTISRPVQIILNSAPNLELTLEVSSAVAAVEVDKASSPP